MDCEQCIFKNFNECGSVFLAKYGSGQKSHGCKIATYSIGELDTVSSEQRERIKEWISENCQGSWVLSWANENCHGSWARNRGNYHEWCLSLKFELESDAVMFKLAWS